MNKKFYIVLPSNSSTNLYPDNKISSFKVHLSNPLQLDPTKWEVALSEIQFLHSWYNVRKGKNTLLKISSNPAQVLSSLKISEGYYTSVEKLIENIKAKDDFLNPVEIDLIDLNQKVKIEVPKDVELEFNKGSDIARCFGFNENERLGEGISISPSVVTVNLYHSIYVYTDIIENQYTGDFKVPLLRVIPITSRYGDNFYVKYDKPHFFNLNRSRIQTIEIDLRDETGDLISFEGGRSIVTLIFKRKTAKFFD